MSTTTKTVGKVSVVPKGTWAAGTSYSRLDVVSYEGSSYIAAQDAPAGVSLANTSYWQMIASIGSPAPSAEVAAAAISATESWLAANISNPTSPVIDSTLNITNAAAQAKKTGLMTAPYFSPTASYEVGDFVNYQGTLYKCNTAIPLGMAWNSIYWTATSIGNEVSDLKNDLDILNAGGLVLEENFIAQEINSWLDNHPEVTTTVEDHSLSEEKLIIGTLGYVTPEMFGAVGDGETDDSVAFNLAIAFSLLNNIPLYLFRKTYIAKNITQTQICSIYGNGATVNLGTKIFSYGDNFVLENIKIIHESSMDKDNTSGTAFFTYTGPMDKVRIENVEYYCVNSDDTHRGRTFMRILANNVYVNNLRIIGAWSGIIIKNSADLLPEKYILHNIYAENIQTMFYIAGEIDSSYAGELVNLDVFNAIMINTPAQKNLWNRVEGADLIMMNNIRNFRLQNCYSENAIERLFYLNYVRDGFINNCMAIGSQGIKICGIQMHILDPSRSDYLMSDNVTVSNISVKDATNGYCMLFYEAKNINCSNIYYINASGISPEYGIGVTGVCSNISISHVRGEHANRGLFLIYAAANKDNDINNVRIDDVDYNLPSSFASYPAIRILRTDGETGVFAKKIFFKDVVFDKDKPVYNANGFKGLIEAQYCSNLTLENCIANNSNVVGSGINIDQDTCSNVFFYGELATVAYPVVPDFYATSGYYTLKYQAIRNGYITKVDVNHGYNNDSSLYIAKRFVNKGTGLLTYRVQLILSPPISSGEIKIVTENGMLRGQYKAGVFTIIEQNGDIGNNSGSIRFYPDQATIESFYNETQSISFEVIVNKLVA